jgi:hypothetical protein
MSIEKGSAFQKDCRAPTLLWGNNRCKGTKNNPYTQEKGCKVYGQFSALRQYKGQV